ncbi:MAG TPA: hypothetical protein VH278_04455 [Burkholderiaceae bacterium]|nr:hypothetical protein [Burkholderiaceae bacterium]
MPGKHTEFPSSDFAITSVNVGDRLDQREIDDRKQQDEFSFYTRRNWGSSLRIWARRLAPYIILLGVVAVAGNWLAEERAMLAADRIAQRLSAALSVPVKVQDSRFRTTPAPAMVLTGVDLGGQVRLDEVALEFTAPSLWQSVISGHRRWGDIVISPLTLSFDQAGRLLTWLTTIDRVVPDSVTKVRIAQLRFAGNGLLPDQYEAVARRESNGKFSSVLLRRLASPGSMQVRLTPDGSGGAISFECDAADWRPPYAPHAAWTEMVGSGHVSADAIELERFTLGAAFGAIEGQLAIRRQAQGSAAWSADGHISSVGIDIPSVIQQITKAARPTSGDTSEENAATPIAGTASIEASLAGAGATPEDALGSLIAAGQIKVRSAALNGINLGYAATRPSADSPSSTASTRFTKMDASFVASSTGVMFKNIHAAAGALSTRGEVTVTPELAVDGLLHVDLGGTRVQAPLRLHVRGDVAHPKFGR